MPFFSEEWHLTTLDNILIIECHKLLTALWKAGCSLIPFFFQEWSSWHTASWIFSRRERWFLHQGQHFLMFRFSIRSVNPQGGKKLKEVVFFLKHVCLAVSRMYFYLFPYIIFFYSTLKMYRRIYSVKRLTNNIFKFLDIQIIHIGPFSQGGQDGKLQTWVIYMSVLWHWPLSQVETMPLWASAFFHRCPS